jgi:hypothetical protein
MAWLKDGTKETMGDAVEEWLKHNRAGDDSRQVLSPGEAAAIYGDGEW